jgi:hypothetical protein
MQNQPKWQQQAGNTGSTANLGNYADPTDVQSTFTSGIQLIDDRFILRVYDDDPVENPSAIHIGSEEFDETPTPQNIVTRYIRAFSELDVPRTWNMADSRTDVGGKLMDFDWGSSHSPSLNPGVSSFKVDIQRTGTIWFNSNHQYRFFGPNDGAPNYYRAMIYGKILRAPIES